MDRARIWTGDLNREALGETWNTPASPVGLYDTTLRDGEQAVGVALGAEAKVAIARALDGLGVDRIEAGFPRVSPEDAEAMREIVAAGLAAETWGFCRALPVDVDAVLAVGVDATVIESPVSDRKLSAYGMTRDTLCERVVEAVSYAVRGGLRVCFFGVDSTRADASFLQEVFHRAVEAGASEIAVVDTIGVATPEAAALLVGQARTWLGADLPIHWHGHNDFGLATAASIAAVRAGATWVQGTINGMGERAGNASLGEVALALEALYGIPTNLQLERIGEVSALVQELSGYALDRWKPVTGEALFARESGAVASQFHDPPAIEPYAPELVGAKRRVVLGKKSGLDSIRIKLADLGLDESPDQWPGLLTEVKRFGARKGGLVSDEEFRAIVASGRIDA
ncbi:MAG: LeuA family protein [Candidatus Dormibacteria bacterium]